MDAETIYTLFREFLEDGLTTLKVNKCDWPDIKIGVAFVEDKAKPVSINWNNNTVYIFPQIFELMFHGNDAPTPIRILAYEYASLWSRSIMNGNPCSHSAEDYITAISLATIKGVQLFNSETHTQQFQLVRNRIKELTGLNTDITIAKSNNHDERVVVYVKHDDASKQYISKIYELIQSESSFAKPLDRIKEGEAGSKSNPFPDVHAAANHILNLEKTRLENDEFRQFITNINYHYEPSLMSFRIPWATPYVAYLDGDEVIKNGFVVNQLDSGRFNFKPNLTNRKFLFRGQAEYFEKCYPNMFRNHAEDYFLKYNIFSCEMQILLDSHPLVQLFNHGVELFNDRFVFEVNYGGLSQHYYNRTQFLDLTSDIEAAKFFAVTTFDMDSNSYIPYDKDGIGVLYYYDIEPDAFRKENDEYKLSAIGKQPFMQSGAQHGYLLAMSKGMNFNTIPQVRYVFFRHNKSVTNDIFKKSENGNLYMRDDILQHHWYNKLMDADRKNTVSHEAYLLNWSYNKQTSKRKILKSLADADIKVLRNACPKFSSKELNDYFYSYASDYWRDFCSDIYFYSPEGRILKNHLINLPNNPDYQKYFKDNT